MMNRKLKQALTDAFQAPPPLRKGAFLKQHRRRELGRWELAACQIMYIRWWVWVLSLALSAYIFTTAAQTVDSSPWYATALTPFLALLAVTENGRSQLYLMEELELACRVSRQSTILARMVALGLFHLVLLGVLTPPLAVWDAVGMARAGVYLLTPYLVTAALGMSLTRRLRGQEGLLACGAAAVLVSGLGFAASHGRNILYQPECLPLWVAVLAVAIIAAAAEFIRNIRELEELQWT